MADEAYSVRGPLALVLQLSRIHGVAPLRMESRGNAYVVQISPWITLYSRSLLTLINVFTLIGLVLDISHIGTVKAVKVHTPSSLVVWVVDIALILIITGLGVYRGPSRMKHMIQHLKRINKVNRKLESSTGLPAERSLSVGAIVLLFGLYLLMALDFAVFVLDAVTYEKEMIIVYTYGLHYLTYSMALILHMQVAIVVLLTQSTLKTVNNGIRELINLLDSKLKYSTPLIKNNADVSNFFQRRMPIKKHQTKFDISFSAQKSVGEFADCYIIICNVVRDLNDENGIMLFVMYISFVSFLIVSIYYLIAGLCSPAGFTKIFNTVLQFIWCIYHATKMLLLVEPCHRSHEEMIETRVLVSQLTYRISSAGDPTSTELNSFQKLLILYTPTYSPLSICTLNRSQIAAVIAGVATLLVIIVQQRLIDECK